MPTNNSFDPFKSAQLTRRSIRMFSNKDVPLSLIEDCVDISASAPSGANMQPWTFIIVGSPIIKQQIRTEAEKVEMRFYHEKISHEWRKQLEKLKVDIRKPFLTEAPFLICIFLQKYGYDASGAKVHHYYPYESVGMATGFLVTALQQAGLGCLTYTPAPMNFLKEILQRPENEKPYMIVPVGYPHRDYRPPEIAKKIPDEYRKTLL